MNMETDSIIQYENLPERLKILEKSGQTIADIEKKTIEDGLNRFGWTDEGKIQVARMLGVSRSTIYRRIGKYKLKEIK